MDIYKHDKRENDIKIKIKQKEDELLQHYNDLKVQAIENQYLNGILKDMEKYYEQQMDEQACQYEILKSLYQYLDELNHMETLMEVELEQIKTDRGVILEKMHTIQDTLKKYSNYK